MRAAGKKKRERVECNILFCERYNVRLSKQTQPQNPGAHRRRCHATSREALLSDASDFEACEMSVVSLQDQEKHMCDALHPSEGGLEHPRQPKFSPRGSTERESSPKDRLLRLQPRAQARRPPAARAQAGPWRPGGGRRACAGRARGRAGRAAFGGGWHLLQTRRARRALAFITLSAARAFERTVTTPIAFERRSHRKFALPSLLGVTPKAAIN